MTPSGLLGIMPLLACPHCAGRLDCVRDGVVGCAAGHRFDVARQGYLSLLGNRSRTDTGDSADMVAARAAFLGAGHYRPLAQAIASAAGSGPVLEIGAGTGYYLAATLDRLTDIGSAAETVGIALDSSRYAARRAASSHPGVGSVVADAWSRLPVRDAVVGTVLSVFAPRSPADIARVLRPGGRVVVATPEPDHLGEIRAPLGLLAVDPGKPERLVGVFGELLRPEDRTVLRCRMSLGHDDISALVRMGPSAHHVRPERLLPAVERLAEVTGVTLSVTITTFRP